MKSLEDALRDRQDIMKQLNERVSELEEERQHLQMEVNCCAVEWDDSSILWPVNLWLAYTIK